MTDRSEQVWQNLHNALECKASEVETLTKERDAAIHMLAAWCVAVEENGTGWDDWDEHYKHAAFRDGPLRKLLDAEIKVLRKEDM